MISNNYKDKVKSLKNSKPARTLTYSPHTHHDVNSSLLEGFILLKMILLIFLSVISFYLIF